ncbi:uncharacterized protein LOC120276184 [Dioscorea cayenensis subsp. rotundata]|uniref:Uncharacterized protein LOC120276184 n=1 Tax=Dioscorea cayennensis subsp. rotundata TaxID=55577 RepID=A0AB40CKT9_DIOCR|nr:uncharacterized protein LOC120276184 [Dioscorea cayenensis subsp. rotundata]
MRNYNFWYLHGEEDSDGEDGDKLVYEEEVHEMDMKKVDDMVDMIADVYPHIANEREHNPNNPQEPNEDAKKIFKLLDDAKQPLFPGCDKYSILSFVVKLMHIKCMNAWSNNSFNMLLTLLKDAFPMCKTMPNSNYEAKKMVSDLAKDMRWHSEKRKNDRVLRHPADAESWRNFDNIYNHFTCDPRNVRLGLATDGFNPFGNMNIAYNIWPVILFPYNLPPWMCMKESYSFVTLLIPGPRGPGNDIDVYMRPLIDELKILWESGVDTYDASMKENFQMRSALMWTINDFPAYGYVSGWSTQGKLACPCCNNKTCHYHLRNGAKTCYMGHRRFLPLNHKWREQAAQFDGTKERRASPKQLSGDDVLNQLRLLKQMEFGKTGKKQKLLGQGIDHNWKKHSIFFNLPYWHNQMLRHNLDVMHIEKNVFDNIIGTLMNIEGKTKDSLKARLDLQEMGIRQPLHPKEVNGRILLPAACYMLSNDEKRALCQWLQQIKFPDGYSANLSRCVNVKDNRISGMKTHDCHVFLERLLPLAVRDLLPRPVSDALTELSMFFKALCSKILRSEDLDRLQEQIARILCKLEKIFPPSFFDIMVHLPIHLAWEAKVGGPVNYRWMYSIERYMHKLKGYVRNKSRPEGSIAEGYLADECLTFCS